MNAKRPLLLMALPVSIAAAAFYLAGCGGGSVSSNGLPRTSANAGDAVQTVDAPPVVAPDASQPPLAMPANVAGNSTVELACGRVYQGTLDLRNKTNVTVRTAGACGKAVLTPGQAIGGWSLYQGSVYSALISFDAAQIMLDGQPIPRAHWPNRPQTWARSSGATANSISYAMPNADLAGATLVFRPYEWAIEARTITGYSGNTMSLASTGNLAYDGYAPGGATEFYVEGKLWMLDAPGEWAVSGGRLYMWAPDGQSPEGRVWASPDASGIEATDSSGIAIDGVRIFGAANGINALGASNLRVTNTEIVNSSENGIENAGGSGLYVDGAGIRNSRHDAISVKWGGGGETIKNSRIDASGTIGMPTNARAAINLTASTGSTIAGNTVTNSGYIGIRSFRNGTVSGNTVDGACLVLTDCGGIFNSAPDKAPLNARIENNVVRNVAYPQGTQKLVWAIYLGDHANAVTVSGNTITGNTNGMNLFDGFNNSILGNAFSGSTQAHIQMAEDGSSPSVRDNVVSGNSFTAKNGEEIYRISSDLGSASVAQFASYDNNTYVSSSPYFANFNGEALSFAQWQARTGQDAASTFRTP